MNRALPGRELFPAARDRTHFLGLVADAAPRTGLEVHAYCLMDTHFHLLVTATPDSLSRFMRLVAGRYAKHVNGALAGAGPVFRSRFASRTLPTPEHVATVVRYIHRNAVDVVGEEGLADYPWSSLRAYLGLASRPTWLRTDVIADMTQPTA